MVGAPLPDHTLKETANTLTRFRVIPVKGDVIILVVIPQAIDDGAHFASVIVIFSSSIWSSSNFFRSDCMEFLLFSAFGPMPRRTSWNQMPYYFSDWCPRLEYTLRIVWFL